TPEVTRARIPSTSTTMPMDVCPPRCPLDSADGGQRRHAELPRALGEPLEHLAMEGNALGAALFELLRLGEPRIEHALLAGGVVRRVRSISSMVSLKRSRSVKAEML